MYVCKYMERERDRKEREREFIDFKASGMESFHLLTSILSDAYLNINV